MPNIYGESDILVISLANDNVYDLYIPAKFSTYLTAGKPIFGIVSGIVASLIKEYELGCASNPSNLQEIINGFDNLYGLDNFRITSIKKNTTDLYHKLFASEVNMKKLTNIVIGESGNRG